jgi:1-deoxy-D-xylulose-5-phosphate reductoisomerase
MADVRTVSVFGATGSVGLSTLDLIYSDRENYDVRVLTAHSNAEKLAELAKKHNAKHVVLADDTNYEHLKSLLAGTDTTIECGREALLSCAEHKVDWSMAAIVGMAGLEPLMRQIEHSKVVAIANKEPLVAAAPFILEAAKNYGTSLLPVDSEHNAIFQVLQGQDLQGLEKVVLTASGGPFLDRPIESLYDVTPAQAVAHPTWTMGAKISVDSATMMNKALEVIEACHFFGLPPEKVEVLIHPQSTVHGMAEYSDGSVLCQMGAADMRTPIAHALSYPNRMTTSGDRLNLETLSRLDFKPVDLERFPAVALAYECMTKGQAACIAFNAANEVAVDQFLKNTLGFMDIVQTTHHIISLGLSENFDTVQNIIDFDQKIRQETQQYLTHNKKVLSA